MHGESPKKSEETIPYRSDSLNRFAVPYDAPVLSLTKDGAAVETGLTAGEVIQQSGLLLWSSAAEVGHSALASVSGLYPDIFHEIPSNLFLHNDEFDNLATRYRSMPGNRGDEEPGYLVIPTGQGWVHLSTSCLGAVLIESTLELIGTSVMGEPGIIVAGLHPCWRPEEEITPGWREMSFIQTGIELITLPPNNPNEEDEILLRALNLAWIALQRAGIPPSSVSIRINDYVGILYELLGSDLSFLQKEDLGYEAMNVLARHVACGQAGDTNTREITKWRLHIQNLLEDLRNAGRISMETLRVVMRMVETAEYSPRDLRSLSEFAYQRFRRLDRFAMTFNERHGTQIVRCDPLSARGGLPVYETMTIQLDVVLGQAQVYPEVGGGGAYPSTLSLALQKMNYPARYAVGFGLGNMRLRAVLNKLSQAGVMTPMNMVP